MASKQGKMKRKNLIVSDGDSRNIIIFHDGKNNPKVEVLFHQEMLWLKQSQIAELFDVKIPAVSKHLKNIFEDGELKENSVVSILEITAGDGFTLNAPPITTLMMKLHAIFTQRLKINCIGQFMDIQQRKLFCKELIIKNPIWV